MKHLTDLWEIVWEYGNETRISYVACYFDDLTETLKSTMEFRSARWSLSEIKRKGMVQIAEN